MKSCSKEFASWTPGAIISLLQCSPNQSAPALTHIKSPAEEHTISYTELRCAVEHLSSVVGRLHALLPANSNSPCTASLNPSSTSMRSQTPIVIAICVEMGIPAIAMHLAVMNTNACLYIDPEKINDQNSRAVFEEVKPEFVIMDEYHWTQCYWLQRYKVSEETIDVFGQFFYIISLNQETLNPLQLPTDLTYIITTTGTTGAPKIVYVPHDCIAPNVSDFLHMFELASSDVFFSAAPLSFDPSVVNMLASVVCGAEMVFASRQALCSVDTIRCLMGRRITLVQATPSLLTLWNSQQPINMNLLAAGSTVRVVALGGECLPHEETLKCWFDKARGVKLYNLYGITEVSSWSSIKCICLDSIFSSNLEQNQRSGLKDRRDPMSANCQIETCRATESFDSRRDLGIPLSETVISVVKDGKVIMEGKGEIFLGRKHNCFTLERSSNNTEAFTELKSSIVVNGVRLIPSGDSGFVRGGSIFFMDRIGRVVKHFGQKISLLDLEQTCVRFSEVEDCHVLYREEILVCFLLMSKNVIWSAAISKALRHAMKVPCNIVLLDRVPINSHGKVDQKKLLNLIKMDPGKTSCAATDVATVVECAWEEILFCKPKPDANFIKAGGDSMKAVLFLETIKTRLDSSVSHTLDVLLNNSYSTFLKIIVSLFQSSEFQSQASRNDTKNRLPNISPLRNTFHDDIKNESAIPSAQSTTFVYDSNDTLPNDSPPSDTFVDDETNDSVNGSPPSKRVVNDAKYTLLDDCPQPLNPSKKNHVDESNADVIISRLGYFERGIKRNPTEKCFPKRPELVWSYNLKKCIDSSPVIVCLSGRTMVLVGSHSRLFCCLDAVTGIVLWTVTLEGRMEASPAVNASASRVYTGCYAGVLYCVRISDGIVLWKFHAAAEVKSTPVVDFITGHIYFGCHDKRLYCLRETGELVWKAFHSGGSIFASPCLVDGHVLVGCLKGDIGCYEKMSGTLLWKCSLSWPLFASLTRFSGGVVTASVDKYVYALSLSGTMLWRYNTNDQCYCTPAVMQQGSQEVIVGCNNKGSLFVLTNKGELLLLMETGSKIVASPFLYMTESSRDGKLICVVATTEGTVLFVEWRPRSHLNGDIGRAATSNISLKTGHDWKRTDSLQSSSIGQGSSGPALKVFLKFSLRGEVFSSPIVHGGRLFICSRDNLIRCFSLNA